MHKCIFWLQAVVKILTNETARALDILAKQHSKVPNAIYQNCLALDYLLASKGGVCGKFNLRRNHRQNEEKCLCPVQTWRGWNPKDLFGGWFSALGRFKTLMGRWLLCWKHV
jgi:hypothetical protein